MTQQPHPMFFAALARWSAGAVTEARTCPLTATKPTVVLRALCRFRGHRYRALGGTAKRPNLGTFPAMSNDDFIENTVPRLKGASLNI